MNYKTAIYSHEDCLLHTPIEGHPENSGRLKTVLSKMKKELCGKGFDTINWVEPYKATYKELLLAHDKSYVDEIIKKSEAIKGTDTILRLDEDTFLSSGSIDAVLYGVGSACNAVDDVYDGKYHNAFCLMRPPGHHALKDKSMGFCLFGNIAIAAKYALLKEGINKVAIIDFDVHHGNGTEDLVKDDPNILFFSIHQGDCWPYEHHEDRGPHNTIQNIAVPENTDASVYHSLFEERVVPMLEEWQPDFIFISAGFDAHRDDPPSKDTLLNDAPGRQNLLEEDFDRMTQNLMRVAKKYSNDRIVSVMEGGYNPEVLAKCCVSHAKTLSKIS